jgi:hypothetical protein
MSSYDLTIPTGSDYVKVFTLKQDGQPMQLGSYSAHLQIVKKPGELSSVVFSTTSGHITNGGTNGTLTIRLSPADIATIDGNFYKLEVNDGTADTEILSGNLFLLDETKVGVEYLIPYLRLKIGDVNPLTYRYLDEWLKLSLILSVKKLYRYWESKYLITDEGIVSRNENYSHFEFNDNYGVIQQKDEDIIITMAAIVVLEGSLENSAWSMGSWRDAEISYSNIEQGRLRTETLRNLKAELDSMIKSPMKRLTKGSRASILEEVPTGSVVPEDFPMVIIL